MGVVLVALVLAQLLLPRIAADRISSRIKRYGTVRSVEVSAWPAVKLLWDRADSVRVRAEELHLSPAQGAALALEARHTGRLDFSAASVQLGPLLLGDVHLTKRGSALHAQAHTSAADVAAAMPRGVSVALVRSEDGQVTVRAGGGLFGVGATVEAVARARAGSLVVRPVSFPLSALQLTLFSDPHVYVLGVAVHADRGEPPPGYVLSMSARLR